MHQHNILGKRSNEQRCYLDQSMQQMQAIQNGNCDIVAQLVHMNVTLAENMNMMLKMNMGVTANGGAGYAAVAGGDRRSGMLQVDWQQHQQQQYFTNRQASQAEALPRNEYDQFGLGPRQRESQNKILKSIDGELDEAISQAKRIQTKHKKQKTGSHEEKILTKRQNNGKPFFKRLSDDLLLFILNPALETKLRGQNHCQRAKYFMSLNIFEGVELPSQQLGKIYRYFADEYGQEPQIQNKVMSEYSNNQIEFIKDFIRKTPISETNSIYSVVNKINQTRLFSQNNKSLTYYFLKKLISEDYNKMRQTEQSHIKLQTKEEESQENSDM